ncbi:flavodoxin family protein [Thermophilibacter provencensis]|uniref:flavodoxin family protein n=1 Tax=Thermophilibacter provencensis TaxID=1852386 RepID=UPI00094AAA9B|nr:NAD(P)H-dependent oxidoreductase [Thermophilibacter provencensis]
MILFINGSPNKDGNTARLARELIGERPYEQLNLAERKVYGYGQRYDDDDFDDVLGRIQAADTLVVGSPVYWHNLSGMLRNLLDRFYGPVPAGSMSGKTLYFVFQGGAPTKEMLEWGEYTMKRFAAFYGMSYGGMVNNLSDAERLSARL